MAAVALLHAEAGMTPTGTGSFSPFTNFSVVVQNLDFTKIVGIWGRDASTGAWSFSPCSYSRSVPGNLEVWVGHQGRLPPGQFDVEYQALGNIYWDNNAGFNYALDIAATEMGDGVNTAVIGPSVYAVEFVVDGAGNLNVDVLVKNLAFAKQVALVYTTNNWVTFQNAFGSYTRSFPPAVSPHQVNAELWNITVPVGAGTAGQFAAFYTVAGTTYWDNNFGLNYTF